MKQWFDKKHKVYKLIERYKEDLDFKSKDYEEAIHHLEETGETVVVSLKIDGELNGIYFDGTDTYLVSRYGRIRTELPLSEEITKILKRQGIKELIAFGELYVVDEKGNPIKYADAMSILRDPDPEDEERIRMIVFGLYEIDNKEIEEEDYWKEYLLINKIFKGGKYVKPAAAQKARVEDIKEFWDKVLKGQAEGLVIHGVDVIKVKPIFTQDLVVIGVEQSKKHPEMVGSLLLAYMPKKNEFRYAGSVGTGIKQDERYELMKLALKCKVDGPEKVRVIWVDPYKFNKIVEVKSDLILQHPTPTYKFEDNKYIKIGEKMSAVGQKPRIIRWREDKKINTHDLRLEQIPGFKEDKITVEAALKPGTEEDIVIPPNEYYPNGLTKRDIYEYYKENSKFLDSVKGHDLLTFIRTDKGIVLRRYTDSDYYRIESMEDLEKYNTGRNVEWHIVVGNETNVGWVDFDLKPEFELNLAKEIVTNVYKIVKKLNFVKDIMLKFSGHSGFHILVFLKDYMDTHELKEKLTEAIRPYIEKFESANVTFKFIKKKNAMRVDLSTLHETGSIRAPWSLSAKTGLISLPLSLNQLKYFKFKDAKI